MFFLAKMSQNAIDEVLVLNTGDDLYQSTAGEVKTIPSIGMVGTQRRHARRTVKPVLGFVSLRRRDLKATY